MSHLDPEMKNILADLGAAFGDKPAEPPDLCTTFGDLQLDDPRQRDTVKVMAQLLGPLFGSHSQGMDDEKLACLLDTVFVFLNVLEEEQGLRALDSLTEKMMKSGRLPACLFLKKMIDLVPSEPACLRLVLRQDSKLVNMIQTLVKEISGDSSSGSQDEQQALWALLTSAMTLTGDTRTDTHTQTHTNAHTLQPSSVKVITEAYVSVLVTLVRNSLDNPDSSEQVIKIARLTKAAFCKQQPNSNCGPLELSGLLEGLLQLQLQMTAWEQRHLAEFEQILSSGLQWGWSQGRDQCLTLAFSTVQGFIGHSPLSLDALSRVSRTVDMLVSCYSSHGQDSHDGEDTSCTRSDEHKVTAAGNKIRLPVEAGMRLCAGLMVDLRPLGVDQKEAIMEHLYVQGLLTQPPSPQEYSEKTEKVSLQTYACMCLHNLRLIKKFNLYDVVGLKVGTAGVPAVVTHGLQELVMGDTILHTGHHLGLLSSPEAVSVRRELSSGLKVMLTSLAYAAWVIPASLEDSDLASHLLSVDVAALLMDYIVRTGSPSVPVSEMAALQEVHQHHRRLVTQILRRGLEDPEEAANILCSHITTDSIDSQRHSEGSGNSLDLSSISLADLTLLMSLISSPTRYQLPFPTMVSEPDPLCAEVDRRLKQSDLSLLTSGSQDCQTEQLELNTVLARHMARLFKTTDAHWDLTLCSLVEWLDFLSESDVLTSPTMRALLRAVTSLAGVVTQICSSLTSEGGDSSELKITQAFREKAESEWKQFFSDVVFSPLLRIYVKLGSRELDQPSTQGAALISPVCWALSVCPLSLLQEHSLPARLSATDTSPLSDQLKTCLNHLSPLLLCSHKIVQDTAYTLLAKLSRDITSQSQEEEASSSNPEEGREEEEESCSPPEAITEVVNSASHFLDFLKVAAVGEQQEIEGRGASLTRGYLMGWMLLLDQFKVAPNMLRAKYAQHYKQQGSVHRLLDHLFRLMPSKVVDLPRQVNSDQSLAILAVAVYRACLLKLPALVRLWWTDQDRRAANYVEKFTCQYLSSCLIAEQIKMSFKGEDSLEGFSIQARPQVREVTAVYEMAEVSVTLVITLPDNFPLGRVAVTCDKVVGVAASTWERWLMQLMIFLQHQNGNIEDGLRLWKGNIDKKLEGIEECMICFSVIHGTNFQLPRIRCRTCKKKFHSSCLYRWFNTSAKSTCPLCRELF